MATPMFYGAKPSIFGKAKDLRFRTTKHERILWECLKGRKMGVRFKRQHPISNFVADFYCHRLKLIIEVDGPSHRNQLDYDLNRTLLLNEFGIKVIRFTNDDVDHRFGKVLETIKEHIAHRAPLP
jgi:very-short-patch-repair endonuclease